MKPADNIEKIFKNADLNTNPKMDETVLNEILTTQDKSKKTKSAETKSNIRRIIMKSKLTKYAAAAVIIIVLAIGINHIGSSIDGASIAFAEVMEQLRNFRPYSYTSTVEWEGKPQSSLKTRMMIFSKSQRREIFLDLDGRIQIFDFSQAPCKSITIFPEIKEARETVYPDMKPGTGADLLLHISRLQELPVEDLGTQEMEGRLAKGFHVPGEMNEYTIWVDVQNGLPVRVERVHIPWGQKLIMTEFDFDVEFDESDFIVKAPPGYEVIRK